jgi:3-dehydroquinate dehydratase-2
LARIFVLNGVNLGSLGERRPEVYGTQALRDIEDLLRGEFPDVEFEFHQTDHEGEFVAWIRDAANSAGLVVNPGAWTHYSYAIRDALEIAALPTVEVHLSDVDAREEFRRVSVIRDLCIATVKGKGPDGYRDALARLAQELA